MPDDFENFSEEMRQGCAESFRAVVKLRLGRDYDDPQEAFWALWLADLRDSCGH